MEHHDWTGHGVGRFLLWWPLCAFLVIAVFPGAGALAIVAPGAGLAMLGGAVAAGNRLRRRPVAMRDERVLERAQ